MELWLFNYPLWTTSCCCWFSTDNQKMKTKKPTEKDQRRGGEGEGERIFAEPQHHGSIKTHYGDYWLVCPFFLSFSGCHSVCCVWPLQLAVDCCLPCRLGTTQQRRRGEEEGRRSLKGLGSILQEEDREECIVSWPLEVDGGGAVMSPPVGGGHLRVSFLGTSTQQLVRWQEEAEWRIGWLIEWDGDHVG